MAPTHVNPPDRPKKQCLGIPIFDTASIVVDPGTLEELPPGEVGEIISSGPQIFQGYWGKPQATAEAFFERDGRRWFRTGDLGRMDEEGYFFLVDRLKRMINRGGLKVWPAEVELLMYGHPDVQEACVVSARDERRGETVKAFVVLKAPRRGQVTAEEIIAWAHTKMAAYKVPTIVAFEESLPKTATGKIQWRVLQEREYQRLGGTRVLRTDARVVAATNRDLQQAMQQGQFREDLYYRLNVFAIRLPPLRDRRDDVMPLSEAFLAEYGGSLGRPPAGISRDARKRLMEYHWPGNVRELRNILERAAILCDGGLITAEHLALTVGQGARPAPPPQAPPEEPPVEAAPAPRDATAGHLPSMERAMIEQALQDARFNKSKAAQALGLTRAQLYVRMRRYGLE